MTDREILDLFHSGSAAERAFSLIIDKYQEKVYWHIRRMVGTHDDANDVMQNTFLKVWKGLANFRADAQLFTWLYRIATNESINHLNSRKRQNTVPFDATYNDADEESNTAPEHYLRSETSLPDGEELQARLTKAIESLPEKQRLVFNLRYFDEMPYEQMSEVLETSVGALKASYHHAAQKVEKYILTQH